MAREFVADPKVLKELAEDEKLLWTGAPEAFPLMTSDNKKSLTSRWLVCILAAVVVVVGYILLSAVKSVNVWVLIIALAVVAYLACMPIMDKKNVYKKCKYYVTDRRAIIHYNDNEIFALPVNGVKCAIVNAQPGCINIDLGACVGIKNNKRRVAACNPKRDEERNVTGMVLYNVEDNETLRKIFS